MRITINTKETETISTNLATLAQELSLPEQGVAIAVNNKMTPRTAWSETMLAENDHVIIIKAACGG